MIIYWHGTLEKVNKLVKFRHLMNTSFLLFITVGWDNIHRFPGESHWVLQASAQCPFGPGRSGSYPIDVWQCTTSVCCYWLCWLGDQEDESSYAGKVNFARGKKKPIQNSLNFLLVPETYLTCPGETWNKSERLVSDFGINISIQPCNQPWMEGKFWLTFSY